METTRIKYNTLINQIIWIEITQEQLNSIILLLV
jgi:hypothetical protein